MNRLPTVVFGATGLLWLAAIATSPDVGHMKAADRYASDAAHQTALGLSIVLFLATSIGVALCAVTALAVRSPGRGSGAIGWGVGLLAAATPWLVISYAGFYSGVLTLVQQHAPRATAYRFIDHVPHPWSHVFDLTLLAFFAGPIVLAVGLRRAGRVSWLPLALWVVGFVAEGATEFSVKPAAVAAAAVCAVALLLMARGIGGVTEREQSRARLDASAVA